MVVRRASAHDIRTKRSRSDSLKEHIVVELQRSFGALVNVGGGGYEEAHMPRSFRRNVVDKQCLTPAKLQTALHKMGLSVEEREAEAIIDDLSRGDGEVDFDTFAALIIDNLLESMSSHAANPDIAYTTNLFRSWDMDGDGFLSADELREGMKELYGRELTEDELDDLLIEASFERPDHVSLDEFIGAMCVVDDEDLTTPDLLERALHKAAAEFRQEGPMVSPAA